MLGTPGTPHTRAQVAGSEALLDALPLPTPQHHQVLLARLTPINTELLSRMRDGAAAGPTDQLPPELLKYAGPAMPIALATLQADMACARHVPLAATDGLMTYIYKKRNLPRNTLNSYRGIRVTSSVGKLCCRALADPIFPVLSDYMEALGPEQFAGRKRHSADMLAVLLDMIISMHGSAPVYILLLDVSKAFGRT